MLSRTTPLIVLATALGSLAATPSGFQPSAKTDLLVTFGSASASNGNVLAKDCKLAWDHLRKRNAAY